MGVCGVCVFLVCVFGVMCVCVCFCVVCVCGVCVCMCVGFRFVMLCNVVILQGVFILLCCFYYRSINVQIHNEK